MAGTVVGALARVRATAHVPIMCVRSLHVTPSIARNGRGPARKSPRTLLRLYAEGKLKGSEALKAAALVEAQNAERALEQRGTQNEPENDKPSDTLSLSDARHVIRAVEAARPRNAYELHIVTSVPSNQTNAFRGRISFPKDPRVKGETVLVFAEQGTDAAQAAEQTATQLEQSGSSMRLVIGGNDMIADTVAGRVPSFSRVLCTSALLPNLSRSLARALGPKGLMPSTKRGTVVDDAETMQAAIEQLVTGVDWRGDRVGVVRAAVGRISFTEAELRANVQALLDAVIQKAASGLAGTKVSASVVAGYMRDISSEEEDGRVVQRRSIGSMKRALSIVRQVHLSSTQGPGIKLRLDDVL